GAAGGLPGFAAVRQLHRPSVVYAPLVVAGAGSQRQPAAARPRWLGRKRRGRRGGRLRATRGRSPAVVGGCRVRRYGGRRRDPDARAARPLPGPGQPFGPAVLGRRGAAGDGIPARGPLRTWRRAAKRIIGRSFRTGHDPWGAVLPSKHARTPSTHSAARFSPRSSARSASPRAREGVIPAAIRA